PGAPGWIVTFADLMSILLTFFILILSFSVQDEKKYYDMVGSIREAFGTQDEIIFAGMVELFGNPYNEFAASMVPVPISTVSLPDVGEGAGYGDSPLDDDTMTGNPDAERQDLASSNEGEEAGGNPEMDAENEAMLTVLEPDRMFSEEQLFEDGALEGGSVDSDGTALVQMGGGNTDGVEIEAVEGQSVEVAALTGAPQPIEAPMSENERAALEAQEALEQRAREVRDRLVAALANELEGDILSIDGNKTEVTIRFPDSVAFGSGSDILKDSISSPLMRLADVLRDTEGEILVSGHTDSIPISTSRFRSNWDLSTARAVSVIHQLEKLGGIGPGRLAAIGYADTRPLAPETTAENRALNRRVEVTLRMVETPPADGEENSLP
ncbi:MAG: OmpA family protein, partial [Pseudomonadota bacterium]